MGMNQIGMLAGTFAGCSWAVCWRRSTAGRLPRERAVRAPGTVWAYLMLHETATIRAHQRLDIPGNVLFAVGLTLVLVGFTTPSSPTAARAWVGAAVVLGEIAAGCPPRIFIVVERRVPDPMFRLELFRIRMFAPATSRASSLPSPAAVSS